MNIFVVDEDPHVSASQLCDKHVVKMILETAQLLCTAHRVLDGVEILQTSVSGKTLVKRWVLPDLGMDRKLLRNCHTNHPCSIWCRATSENYMWLHRHGVGLLIEYSRRYNKMHVLQDMFHTLSSLPANMVQGGLSDFAQAMPDQYKSGISAVTAYRRYYIFEKSRFAKWKNSAIPQWYVDGCNSNKIQMVK
jgi:hypothetical protein